MFENKSLHELMLEDLPSISKQKRLSYRTTQEEVTALYKLINKTIFNNKLAIPELEVVPRCREYWGLCFGSYIRPTSSRSNCKIRLMDKWYCRQWLIIVLAHEMCHQYQWDIEGERRIKLGKDPIMSHGPSFFVFRDKLARYGIPLKKWQRMRKWFKTQDVFKC
jgi:hypothetical protein